MTPNEGLQKVSDYSIAVCIIASFQVHPKVNCTTEKWGGAQNRDKSVKLTYKDNPLSYTF